MDWDDGGGAGREGRCTRQKDGASYVEQRATSVDSRGERAHRTQLAGPRKGDAVAQAAHMPVTDTKQDTNRTIVVGGGDVKGWCVTSSKDAVHFVRTRRVGRELLELREEVTLEVYTRSKRVRRELLKL